MMRAVFALSLIAALAGCSTMEKINPVNWFSSAPKVKPAELDAISSSATLATLWQASVGSAGGYVLTPAVVGSSVYAAAQDGTLARFDNGGQAWRINAGQPIWGRRCGRRPGSWPPQKGKCWLSTAPARPFGKHA
jgi:outer membrane protein assembly factor BamB